MNKDVITVIAVIVLIILAILTQPYKIKVKNGEISCSNILGQTVSCR